MGIQIGSKGKTDAADGIGVGLGGARHGMGDAAGAMDVASAETIGAGMAALGGACKDCHTAYRIPG